MEAIGDYCGSEPPETVVDDQDREWTPGDCWCTLPTGHRGKCQCGPCVERHGAPGWTTNPENGDG